MGSKNATLHIRTLVRNMSIRPSSWPSPGKEGNEPSSSGGPGFLLAPCLNSSFIKVCTAAAERLEFFWNPHLVKRFLYICSLHAQISSKSVYPQRDPSPHGQSCKRLEAGSMKGVILTSP